MAAILENEHLKISIKELGAELSSLVKKSTQTEYIWQANPKFWGRHAPVLFPIVGKLKEEQYLFTGQVYEMKQHGLARNMKFHLIKRTVDSIVYELKSNAYTLDQYPFPFRLQISYTLNKQKLSIRYRVVNPSKNTIYFSIGGHPAFRCPLKASEKRSDYQLIFEKNEVAYTQLLDNGIRNGKKALILDNSNKLPIQDDLFDNDALVFDDLQSNWVQLSTKDEPVLTFNFKDFPYLGIWSKNRIAPFVCIEPWFGVADHIQHDQVFSKKEGIIKLAAQDQFNCVYMIEIH